MWTAQTWQALFARPEPAPSVPSEALRQLNRLELFNGTSQLQHGIERFCGGTVCEAGGQVVPPLLKPVQQLR